MTTLPPRLLLATVRSGTSCEARLGWAGLVALENPKTQSDWERARLFKLLPVKLFNALYPFLYLAFAKRYFEDCRVDEGGTETCLYELHEDIKNVFFLQCLVKARGEEHASS